MYIIMFYVSPEDAIKDDPKTEVNSNEAEGKEESSDGKDEKDVSLSAETVSEDVKQNNEALTLITSELKTLQAENKRLHEQATALHQTHHTNTLKVCISWFAWVVYCVFFLYEIRGAGVLS